MKCALENAQTMFDPFLVAALSYPNRTAVVWGDCHYTYHELLVRIYAYADMLEKEWGIVAGDKVAYLLPNGVDIVAVYYAIQYLGAVAVPLNFKLHAQEVGILLSRMQAKLLIYAHQFHKTAREGVAYAQTNPACVEIETACDKGAFSRTYHHHPIPVLKEDISRIQCTGGTTGIPKGAVRTHAADLAEMRAILHSNGMEAYEHPVVLIQCPLEHHGGHSWFTIALAQGATLVIAGAFNAEYLLHVIEAHKVTHLLLLPPTTYARLVSCPVIDQFDLSSVVMCQSAAGATNASMVQAIFEAFPQAVVNYGWGQTESGSGMSITLTRDMDPSDPLFESIGWPMEGLSVRLVDDAGREVPDGEVGEAIVKTDALMTCYYANDQASKEVFTEEGWLRTGDMMQRGVQGAYFLRSRKKGMVKSGGENVFVGEVEQALLSHCAVRDCVVFGTNDPIMGEAVAAVVECRPEVKLSASELQAFCKTKIASYKKPRYIAFCDHIHRDAAGKVSLDEVKRYFETQKESCAPRSYERWEVGSLKVFQIKVPFSKEAPAGWTNVYALVSEGQCVLIDTGLAHEESFHVLTRALAEVGIDPHAMDIALTHFHIDHTGLAGAIESDDTSVYISEQDYAWSLDGSAVKYRGVVIDRLLHEGFPEAWVDEIHSFDNRIIQRAEWPQPIHTNVLVDGQEISVGSENIEVIFTPGHTPGHCCFYHRASKSLFCGDHLLYVSSPNLAPFTELPDSVTAYIKSLSKIRSLPVSFIFPGHGQVKPIEDAHEFTRRIDWLIEHHQERLNDICRIISEHPGKTGTEIASSIPWNVPFDTFEHIPPIQRWVMVCETLAHLDHLVLRGVVDRDETGAHPVYFIQSDVWKGEIDGF